MTRWRRESQDSADGFALVTMIAVILPLLALVMSAGSQMARKDSEQLAEIGGFRALQAAEAGIDEAIYRSRNHLLVVGTLITLDLGSGHTCEVDSSWLDKDGLDNDLDGSVDEIDEHVIQLTSRGMHGPDVKQLACYVQTFEPPRVESPVTLQNPAVQIKLNGTTTIDGNDENMDGSAGSEIAPGIIISSAGTTTDLDAELTGAERGRVLGSGGTPSLGTGDDIDVTSIVDHFRTHADQTLAPGSYVGITFGNGLGGTPQATFCDGNLTLSNVSQGAGVLVVNGDLRMQTGTRFDGIIVVTGALKMTNSAVICGAVVQGIGGTELEDLGGSRIVFSRQALTLANTVWSRPVVSGWRELSRN